MSTWAAQRANDLVAAVRDHPEGRRELAGRLYSDHTALGGARGFGRSELAFLDWEIRRGVLNPLDAEQPGSPWWRAVNESLLRDAAETGLIADGGSCEAPPARWSFAHLVERFLGIGSRDGEVMAVSA
jgi:hypothetical protein